MAEVKNAFIKSKMNKDLDSRLIPQGEYRDAVNIQVSKSEGDDVGALENVLGNHSVADFEADSGVSNLTCIGYIVDEFSNTVYLFFTNYTDPYLTPTPTYSQTAENFIYSYNINSNTITKLVQGAFLNFSTNRPIIGVNVLEQFLFFTDNRNQPRKININLAAGNGVSFYDNEDKISVAKYYPYQSIEVRKPATKIPAYATADVNGDVLNSKTVIVDNVSGSITPGLAIQQTDNLSGSESIFAYVVAVNGNTLTLNRKITLADNAILGFFPFETSMYDAANEFIPINDGTPGVGPVPGTPTSPNVNNSYYESEFPGDPQYLEDKFVRFSYRFKFIDGEYSVIAPFSQECFIPKQDGYFLGGDEEQTVASTVVEFMENKVTQIKLQVPLPANLVDITDDFHIEEVDIIYKESDGLAVQVVETLTIESIIQGITPPIKTDFDPRKDHPFFEYVYNSLKPYKTLPEKEITRVYDKVPVKALGQEIISNRVVYSNFQDKHTPPDFIKYQVSASDKYTSSDTSSAIFNSFSVEEYPNHSVKQNRNYQVGIVLADKYGRQSTVILSNDQSAQTTEGFGADTVYLPYRNVNDSITFLGNSLKVQFNETISSDKNESFLTPGLYNSDPTDPNYNPTGWYTYKIVVKQLEQDYYNVYASGALKGTPFYDTTANPSIPLSDQNASFITLLNDNINKIPRDLTEVGPQDRQFRSSVELFGIVENTEIGFTNIGNIQYLPNPNFPKRNPFTTNTIEDLFDLFDVAQFDAGTPDVIPVTSTNSPYYAFYRSESNPFVAEFITSQTAANQFGVVNPEWTPTREYEKYGNLSIFETKPVVSKIDIFWETTTSGLIEDINTAVQESDPDIAAFLQDFTYNHTEAYAPGTDVTGDFYFENVLGVTLTNVGLSMVVTDNTGINRTSDFTLVNVSNPGNAFGTLWKVQTNSYFYYGQNAPQKESYTFQFTVEKNSVISVLNQRGSLSNVDPTNTTPTTSPIDADIGQVVIIPLLSGLNGSNTGNPDTNVYTQGLTFSIASQTNNGQYVIVNNDEVRNTQTYITTPSSFTLRVTDAGGASVDSTYSVTYSPPGVPPQFETSQIIYDGEGVAVWFTETTTGALSGLPNYIGGQSLNNLTGVQVPTTIPGSITNDICTQPSSYQGVFRNKMENSFFCDTAVSTGDIFYLIIYGSLINSGVSSTSNRYMNVRWAFDYRSCSGGNWTEAVDIDGNPIGGSSSLPSIAGTWRYDSTLSKSGFDTTGNALYGLTGILVDNNNTTTQADAAFVYAFSTRGDYRLLMGNLESGFGAYQGNTSISSTSGSINCSSTLDTDIRASYEFGDFNSPSGTWNPDGDGVYEYQIATFNGCGNVFTATGTSYYAAEPFAKYVTQLYTDVNLQNQATGLNNTFRYRRLQERGGSVISNPEYTKDGAYRAFFSSGNKTSASTPCFY